MSSNAALKREVQTPWLTTEEAAEYVRLDTEALLAQVRRGHLVPDSWGGRGRLKTHRFRRETLDRFLEGK